MFNRHSAELYFSHIDSQSLELEFNIFALIQIDQKDSHMAVKTVELKPLLSVLICTVLQNL